MFRLCRLLLRHVGLILRFPVGGLGRIMTGKALLLPGHRLHTRRDAIVPHSMRPNSFKINKYRNQPFSFQKTNFACLLESFISSFISFCVFLNGNQRLKAPRQEAACFSHTSEVVGVKTDTSSAHWCVKTIFCCQSDFRKLPRIISLKKNLNVA